MVVDNGSTDNTGQVARDHGAVLLRETTGGYGTACRRALRHLEDLPMTPSIVVFIDPLGPEDPQDIDRLLAPFRHENAELVLASFSDDGGKAFSERAMIGLIAAIYGHGFSDLSSFRALRYAALVALGLSAKGEGWNVEMLVKAVRLGLNIVEVPVSRIDKPMAPRRGGTGRKLMRILRHATAR